MPYAMASHLIYSAPLKYDLLQCALVMPYRKLLTTGECIALKESIAHCFRSGNISIKSKQSTGTFL